MTYIETPDGVALYYEEAGDGETILLVHGWTMNSQYWWQKTMPVLADSHHVVAVDLRGHGQSENPETGHTFEQYAQDVHHLIDTLDLSDVTLAGWSMGANVALSYFEQFGSENLQAAVLVDQSPKFYSEPGWDYPLFGEFSPEALAGLVEGLQTDREGLIKGQVLPAFFAETPSDAVLDEMYAETMQTPTPVAVTMLEALANADFRDVVGRIDVPTLLCYGAQSAVFPGNPGQWMHEQIPTSTLVEFEQSSHCPFWEEPETFNEHVDAFVSDVADRGVEPAGAR